MDTAAACRCGRSLAPASSKNGSNAFVKRPPPISVSCLACRVKAKLPTHKPIHRSKNASWPLAMSRLRTSSRCQVPRPFSTTCLVTLPCNHAQHHSLSQRARVFQMLRRNDPIVHSARPVHQPQERPTPMSSWQIDFKDASTVPADPYGKQQHVVEILNVVDMGTSIVVAAHVHANFHAQTALQAMAQVLIEHGKPDSITLDRDTRWVGSPSGRDFPSAFLRFL